MSRRVTPWRALRAGFQFRFGELEDALRDLLSPEPSVQPLVPATFSS